MKIPSKLAVGAAVAVMASMAMPVASSAAPAPSADATAIRSVLSRYNAALNGGRTEAVLPLYTEDGIFMPPFSKSAIGKTAVRQAYDTVFRELKFNVKFDIAELVQLALRGSEANHTLVLIDGIEVSDPYSGEFDFGTLVADDAARVEVLRGQQSAIYGSDAIGGVVQYITPTGRDAPGVSARIEGGSFGTVNAAARAAGVSGTLDYALSATLDTTAGSPNARGGRRDLSNDAGAFSLKSTWSPIGAFRLNAVLRYARTEAEFNNPDADAAHPSYGLIVDSPGVHLVNDAFYALLRSRYDLLDGGWTHAATIQLADTKRNTFGSGKRTSGDKGARLKGSYETTLKLEGGVLRHQLTAALDVERERYRNTDPTRGPFAASTGRRQVDNIGVVGQYDLQAGDQAAFGASVRQDFNNCFRDTTTYRVQASYRFESGTRLSAATGTGVKNPGFYELFGYYDGRYIGNADLRPERSEGWEAGIEQSLGDGKVTIGATYFESRLRDEIFTDYSTGIGVPGNRATDSKQRGVESFFNARIGSSWRIDAAYTYLHARENGLAEVRRPRDIASLAFGWHAPEDRFSITWVARYNGGTADNAFIDPVNFGSVRVRLRDYLLLNLNAEAKITDVIGFFARVENIADERYEDVFSFTNPGRAAYAGLRARF